MPIPAESRRRIYSELVPLDQLASAPILSALAERKVQLLAAVQPDGRDDALRVVERARELDLSIGLWPLLPNDRGRWLHSENTGEFARWIDDLLLALDRRKLSIDALVLDLEPPISELRRLTGGHLGAMRAWLSRRADPSVHRAIVAMLAERGIESVAAIMPPVLVPGAGGRGWEKALGTPIDAPYRTLHAMLYTSLLEGYSRGVLTRSGARSLLVRFAQLARGAFGDRAGVSVGTVGIGALGDENAYRDVSELADDVALTRLCGVEDIALFDLSGVLARPEAERWLDALAHTPPASDPPAQTLVARALAGALWLAGHALDVAIANKK
ncbi:MAG TPA: hypothetical protein VND93_02625 [Myxococcales bacterium]|nr:hypothetical protein [Myxococcales bacterium]